MGLAWRGKAGLRTAVQCRARAGVAGPERLCWAGAGAEGHGRHGKAKSANKRLSWDPVQTVRRLCGEQFVEIC